MDTALLDTAIPVNSAVSSDEAAAILAGDNATASSAAPESGEVIVVPPVVAAPPPVDSSAQIAALEARITALSDRLATSPAPPAQFDHNQLASAVIAAENARRADFERQQAARIDLQPPTFTEDQKTALVSDPDALLAAMQAWARHGAKVALAQVAPHLSDTARKANIAFELAGPNSDAVADWAFNRGRDFAVAGGMSVDEYDGVSQTVYDYLWQASQQNDNPQLHFAKMTLNPQTLSTAARMALEQRRGNGGSAATASATAVPAPPIVDKRPPAPTVGAGTHRSDAAGNAPRPNANLAIAEQRLGRKLTPGDVKRLNEVAKKYAAL